jgi:hypothetical protein
MAKIICVIIFALSSYAPAALAQRRAVGETKNSVRIERSKPSIYIEFVKAGVCYPSETTTVESWSPCSSENKEKNGQGYEAVWLRLRNNSRWTINFDALSVYVPPVVDPYKLPDGRWVTSIRNGAEIGARYRVEAEIV